GQSVHPRGAEGESDPPARPPRWCLRGADQRVTALGTGARIEVDRREVRLRPLGEADGTVPPVVEPDPQPVARAVGQVVVQGDAPVALRGEPRGGGRPVDARDNRGSYLAAH